MSYFCGAMKIQDTYKYSSIDVARCVIAYANRYRFGINLTKMLKLTFFLYGVYLAWKGERLTDEHPVAWTYGPVFERARRFFMHRELLDVSMDDVVENIKSDDDFMYALKYTFDICGKFTASSLVEWTHREGSPWSVTIEECKGREGGVIRDDVIYKFFHGIMYEGKRG